MDRKEKQQPITVYTSSNSAAVSSRKKQRTPDSIDSDDSRSQSDLESPKLQLVSKVKKLRKTNGEINVKCIKKQLNKIDQVPHSQKHQNQKAKINKQQQSKMTQSPIPLCGSSLKIENKAGKLLVIPECSNTEEVNLFSDIKYKKMQRFLQKQLHEVGSGDDTFLKCIMCFQNNFVPYDNSKLNSFQIKHIYSYLICRQDKCLEAIHIGCLPSIEKYDIKLSDYIMLVPNTDTESLRVPLKVYLYDCDYCLNKKETRQCCACQTSKKGLVFNEVKVIGQQLNKTLQVHQICAILLPTVFMYDNNEKFSIKYEDLQKADKDGEGSVEPLLSRFQKQSQRYIQLNRAFCVICKSRKGMMVPCGDNFKRAVWRLENQDSELVFGHSFCDKVVHPSCAFLDKFQRNEDESKNIGWDLRITQQIEEYEKEKQTFIASPEPGQENLIKVLTQIAFNCTVHSKQAVNCFVCIKDPEEKNGEQVQWLSCDYCCLWYHDICVKKNIYQKTLNLTEQQNLSQTKTEENYNSVKLEKQAIYKCELCTETARLQESGAFLIIDEFEKNQDIERDGENFLTLDKRTFKKMIYRKDLMGIPTMIQLKISTKLWLAVNTILSTMITTETLLKEHEKFKEHFPFNVDNQQQQLIIKKQNQAAEIQTLLEKTVKDIQQAKTEWFDVIDENENIVTEAIQSNKQIQVFCRSFIEKLMKFEKGGHLIGDTEDVFVAYKRRELLIKTAELIQNKNLDFSTASIILDDLFRVDLYDFETYGLIYCMREDYKQWIRGLNLSMMNPYPNLSEQVENLYQKILKITEKDPIEEMERRLNQLQQHFDIMPSYTVILQQMGEENIHIFTDERQTREKINNHIKHLTNIVEFPTIPNQNPVCHTLKILCYLASQPFLVNIQPILDRYKDSCKFEIKAKQYLVRRYSQDSTMIDMTEDLLSNIPVGVVLDEQLVQLVQKRQKFLQILTSHEQEIKKMGPKCANMLSSFQTKCKKLDDEMVTEIENILQVK